MNSNRKKRLFNQLFHNFKDMHLIFIIFILYLIPICLSKSIYLHLGKLKICFSEVSFKLSESQPYILGKDFFDVFPPDEVIINGVKKQEIKRDYNFWDGSLFILRWNNIIFTTLKGMFEDIESLIEIDFQNFDTSLVTNMEKMFMNCDKLQSLHLSNFNTSSVTNMDLMFAGCHSLKSLNLSNFDTSKVTNMSQMFAYCLSLETIDISNFNISSVIDMEGMFGKCDSLKSLNLSNFDASSLINMDSMFGNCKSLQYLDLSNINSKLLKKVRYIFYNCISLTEINLSNFNTSSVVDIEGMFYNCKSLISLNLSNFNTKSVNNMNYLFYGCHSLISLNLSNFDTSLVTTMMYIFNNCHSLQNLDLSNFNTTLVNEMSMMFNNCSSLTSLNLRSFSTSSIINLSYMFYNCKSLEILDISNFDIKFSYDKIFFNVFNMTNSLKYINLHSYKGIDIFSSLSLETNITYCYDNISNIEPIKNLISRNAINNCSAFKDFDYSPLKIETNVVLSSSIPNILNSTLIIPISQISSSTNNNTSTSLKLSSIDNSSNFSSKIKSTELNSININNPINSTYFKIYSSLFKSNFSSSIISQNSQLNPYTTIIYSNMENANFSNVPSTINESNETDVTLEIIAIGIDNYTILNDKISFCFYFICFSKSNIPKILILTVNLFNNKKLRNLENFSEKIQCNLLKNDDFLKYICFLNKNETIDKIKISDDLDFGHKTSLVFSGLSKSMMNNVEKQNADRFSSKKLYILSNSSLVQNNNSFLIKGLIDNPDFYSNNIFLTITQNENNEEKNITCSIKNNNNNSYEIEIECLPENFNNFSINNSLAEIDDKILFIIFNKGSNDLFYKNKSMNEGQIDDEINKKNGLSKGVIIAIVLSSLILLSVLIFIIVIILRKKAKKTKHLSDLYVESSDNINKK